MKIASTVISILADGLFHSGTELGQKSGCSRSAVWKAIQSLRDSGIEIYSVRGRGYRLANQVELLDSQTIQSYLHPKTAAILRKLEVHFELGSTNTHLLKTVNENISGGVVCLAERQMAGRGRRGFPALWPAALG